MHLKPLRRVSVLGVAVALSLAAQADPVKIDSGLISGSVVGEDKALRIYKGIPYAAPPTGEFRWKPPQPVTPWEGVRACDEFGFACTQEKNALRQYGIPQVPPNSEDCLYLNVWTPAKSPGEKLPVMFWIHGGSNRVGWGHQAEYDGEAFARKGVVLVTINYRLGTFGFFAHPLLSQESEHHSSGNYGILDQIAALRWVQRNIAAFGGDPECVTVFGQSAGGVDVTALDVSPLAKGLFHRAIYQSGTAIWNSEHLTRSTPGQESAEKKGELLARKAVGEGVDDVLAALRAIPAEQLHAKFQGQPTGVIVDGWVLPDYPALLYKKGLHHDVPTMAGSTADEGTLFAVAAPMATKEMLASAWRGMFGDRAEDLLSLYPLDTPEERKSSVKLLIDAIFIAGTRAQIRAVNTGKSPAFLYQFTRVEENGRMKDMKAFHAAELMYVFGTLGKSPISPAVPAEKDRELSEAMITYWTQFAATGNPNGGGLPDWPVYTTETDQHLEFGDDIKVGSGLLKEVCDRLNDIQVERYRDLEKPQE